MLIFFLHQKCQEQNRVILLFLVEVLLLSGGLKFYEILKGAPTESPNLPNLFSMLSGLRSQKPKI